jgi:tight adherence protein B
MNAIVLTHQAAMWAVGAGALMGGVILYLLLAPRPARVSLQRLDPGFEAGPTGLTRATVATTGLIDKSLRRRGTTLGLASSLELAGIKMRPQDFALMVIVSALVSGAAGLLLVGPVLGVGLAVLAPVVAKVGVTVMTGRRRKAFANQLDDSLQLMAGNLRAGHSLMQALSSVALQAEKPTSEEFVRVINETRVGRDLGQALNETAARMRSVDFVWVTQAIAINREVGGNLAEVLDGVAHTIRERNQIRGQVQALSAEGKLSAYVLIALPFGIAGFLAFSNPEYIGKLFQSVIGYAMVASGVVLLLVGSLWLRKIVSFKF